MNSPERHGEHNPTETPNDPVARWRAEVLNFALALSLAAMCLITFVLVLQGSRAGVHLGLGILPTVGILAFGLYAKRQPLHVRAYAMVGAIWVGVAFATMQRGFSIPNPWVGSLFACVLASVVLDWRRMWIVVGGTVAIFMGLAVLWVGFFEQSIDSYTSHAEPVNWARVIFIFAVLAVGSSAAVAHLVKNLEASLARSEELVRGLQAAQHDADSARAEAEAANAAKSRFLATMTHDIRTPLTAVVGIADVLQAGELQGQQREQVKVLAEAGQLLLALVEEILDLARAGSGEILFESMPVDLNELVREAGSLFMGKASEKGVTLSYDHTGPGWVMADPLRIRQILVNLIGNAIKFTEEGEVEVRSMAKLRAKDDAVDVELVVRDTGIGLSEDAQAAIFEPFVQAQASTARQSGGQSGGTGLGLSIVRELASLMGGSVTLKSAVGEGSTFTVRLSLPLSGVPREPTGEVPAAGQAPMAVLLVDDNPTNRLVVGMMLENLGCVVQEAENGEQAVAAVVERTDLDLVLMDCMMPVVDGLEATRIIRTRGSSIRVVALTANTTSEERTACLASGMDDFATKPRTLAALQEIL